MILSRRSCHWNAFDFRWKIMTQSMERSEIQLWSRCFFACLFWRRSNNNNRVSLCCPSSKLIDFDLSWKINLSLNFIISYCLSIMMCLWRHSIGAFFSSPVERKKVSKCRWRMRFNRFSHLREWERMKTRRARVRAKSETIC